MNGCGQKRLSDGFPRLIDSGSRDATSLATSSPFAEPRSRHRRLLIGLPTPPLPTQAPRERRRLLASLGTWDTCNMRAGRLQYVQYRHIPLLPAYRVRAARDMQVHHASMHTSAWTSLYLGRVEQTIGSIELHPLYERCMVFLVPPETRRYVCSSQDVGDQFDANIDWSSSGSNNRRQVQLLHLLCAALAGGCFLPAYPGTIWMDERRTRAAKTNTHRPLSFP